MAKIPITTSFRKRSALLNRPVLVWFLIMTCIMMIYPSRKPAQAGYFSDNFIDPSDGNFDVGPWLAEKKGLLPVPILITEPAIGYGGGLAVLYFHGKLGGKSAGDRFEATTDERGRISPPSISGVFGGATENDTWFYGGFHQGIWKNDRIRYIGALAETSLKLNFYGLDGGDGTLGNNPVEYTLDATFLLQRIQFRILDSDVFVGGQYLFMDSGSKFDSSDEITGIPSPEFDIRSGGVGLSISYDTRDNIITPNKGWFAQITASDFGKTWGGDDDFNRYGGQVIFYHDIFPELVLGLRGDGNMVSGDAPFYAYPFIQMRGIKAMRYQGEEIIQGQAELRWDVTSRWSLVGFGGVGTTFVSDDFSEDEGAGDGETVTAQGFGFRYFLARRFGLRVGADVAWSEEETAFYLTFGNAWMN